MAKVFRAGEDLHAASAIAALGLDRAPTDEERQVGKTFNFATIYGQGVYKCASTLGVELDVARKMLDTFHARWPALKLLNNPPFKSGRYDGEPGAIQRALGRKGHITTLWGRKLHPEQPHKALNALIQGCAADLMRASLVRIHGWLNETDMSSHLVNVVHDEAMLDCTADELRWVGATVPGLMTDWPEIQDVVPIEVDIGISTTTWADKAEATIEDIGRIAQDLGRDRRRDETAVA